MSSSYGSTDSGQSVLLRLKHLALESCSHSIRELTFALAAPGCARKTSGPFLSKIFKFPQCQIDDPRMLNQLNDLPQQLIHVQIEQTFPSHVCWTGCCPNLKARGDQELHNDHRRADVGRRSVSRGFGSVVISGATKTPIDDFSGAFAIRST